jgi:hypothetical protein
VTLLGIPVQKAGINDKYGSLGCFSLHCLTWYFTFLGAPLWGFRFGESTTEEELKDFGMRHPWI